MRGQMMKHPASGYWKTVVSHCRGCIFQGFQFLQKVEKTTPEIVSKWYKNLLKTGSQRSQKRSLELIRKIKKTWWKKVSKMRSKKSFLGQFLVLFSGLGPKVSQGGPRDPPRVPPGSNLLQNGSQNDSKIIKNLTCRLSENASQRHAHWACFQIALFVFLVCSYSCRGRFCVTFIQVKSRHSSTWLGGKT